MTGDFTTGCRRAAGTALAALLAAAAAGCGGGGSSPAAIVYPAPGVTITPAGGAANVNLGAAIDVHAVNGHVAAVSVSAAGQNAQDTQGRLDWEATNWTSLGPLHPDTTYIVRATVENPAGKTVTTTSRFRTLRPAATFTASPDWLLTEPGQTYGVGLPLVIDFSRPVTDKAAVQDALIVQAQKPVQGAWRWLTDEQAVYRAETFWPAHQTVTLRARLAGVQASPGVYGTTDQTYTFHIGAARISTVNVRTHRISVRVDGKVVREYGISAGDGSAWVYTTPSGTALTMEKARVVVMTNPDVPEGAPGWYSEPVPLAVRLTDSGIYLHESPGAEWCLGVANCSHGCIRQPAADAEWFYDNSQPGDVVRIEGTDRQMSWDDGWTFYQMPWRQWRASR